MKTKRKISQWFTYKCTKTTWTILIVTNHINKTLVRWTDSQICTWDKILICPCFCISTKIWCNLAFFQANGKWSIWSIFNYISALYHNTVVFVPVVTYFHFQFLPSFYTFSSTFISRYNQNKTNQSRSCLKWY